LRLQSIVEGLRALFHKKEVEQEMDEELRGYLDAAVKEKMRSGMNQEQALRAARVEMGSMDAVKEEIRSVGWEAIVETLWQDIRYGLRQLKRNPGFTAVAVITLALGIGANSALFSLVYAAALRPLPFTHADRLVWVSTGKAAKAGAAHGVSGQELREWQPQLEEIFDQFATFGGNYHATWRRGEQGMHLASRSVSGNFFSLLGVRPWAGRLFTSDDAQAGHGAVAVLGYDFWRRQFGGDLGILGQQMSERGGDYASYVIVGILPPKFVWDGAIDVWLPEQPQTSYLAGLRDYRHFLVVGRLRTGVYLAGARAAMDVLARQEAATHPDSNAGWYIRLELVRDHLHAGGHQGLLLLWAAAGCLLLTACVNVANLLLARARARQGEIAMRLTLGASRRRLVAQLLTESGLLALLGAAVGWAWASAAIRLLAVWGSWFLPTALLRSLVGLHAGALQPSVLAFTTLAAALAVVAFGLVPALRASRPALSHAAPKQRLARGLVVAEVALTTLLVVCAGMLIHSFTRLLAVDPGFASANRLTFSVELPRPPESAAPPRNNRAQYQRKAAWFAELEQRLQALPEVRAVGAADDLPILGDAGGWGWGGYKINGQTLPDDTTLALVSPGYFAAMGAPILAGLDFDTARDKANSAKALILNQAMAALLYPHQNPVGLRIQAPRCGVNFSAAATSPDCVIVGVVGDMRYRLAASAPPTFYYSIPQDIPDDLNFVILAHRDPQELIPQVRTLVANMPSADFGQPYLFDLQTMRQAIAASVAAPRFQSWLVGLFAGLALLLAAVGIYGVESYTVSQRTREFGVRMALGAQPAQVYGLLAGGAARKTMLGIALGLAAGRGAAQLMTHLLYGVRAWDPLTLLAASVALLAVALAASALPARRAMKVDPMVALRYE